MSSIYVSLKKPPASLWCANILRGHPYIFSMNYKMIDISPTIKAPDIESTSDGEENLPTQEQINAVKQGFEDDKERLALITGSY